MHPSRQLGLAASPVSNLTNLLAFRASGLSFARFGVLMALPWLAAIGVEWLVLRRFFATDLVGRGTGDPGEPKPVPALACTVVALTLAGFFVTSIVGINPAFAALAGALALAIPALASGRASPRDIGAAVDIPFLAFVLALGLVVKAVSLHGLGSLAAASSQAARRSAPCCSSQCSPPSSRT